MYFSNFFFFSFTDMPLFGYCPEVDPFVGVECNYCQKLVKTPFFRHHVGKLSILLYYI
jgi:hypothetical protein